VLLCRPERSHPGRAVNDFAGLVPVFDSKKSFFINGLKYSPKNIAIK
jgi:hypothetical protein